MLAIQTKQLTKYYKNKLAVDNVELAIKKGEVFSILGINGAGKTTLIKILSTLTAPTSGEILIEKNDVKKNPIKIKQIINVSPQETAVAPNLTVLENLEFMVGIYTIKNRKKKIDALIELFKLQDVLKQKAKTLSGGWQRKVSIALALINDPEVLFLDEPTLGLDVIARRELWEMIEKLKNKITIILTTHYIEEAQNLSDRIGIMYQGKLTHVGTPQQLIEKANAISFEQAFIKLATGGINH